MKRKPGFVYRICRRCGREYNTSRQEPGGKTYFCPVCEGKKRAAPRAGTSEGRQKKNYNHPHFIG